SLIRNSGATPGRWRRISTTPSEVNDATPAASSTKIHAGQPWLRPSSSAYVTATIDATSSPAPTRSGRPASGLRVSGTTRRVAASEYSATGVAPLLRMRLFRVPAFSAGLGVQL